MEPTQLSAAFVVPVISALLLTLAVIWLFYGWKFYWLFVTLLTAVASAIVGWYFIAPHFPEHLRYMAPLLMAVAGGAIAIPLQRVVAFATTGVLGAAVMVGIAVGFCHVPPDWSSSQLVALAAAGFLIAGLPAAIFYKFLTVIITSGWGAVLALVAASSVAFVYMGETPALSANIAVAFVITWLVLTTIGAIYQWKSQVIHKAQTQ